MKSQGSVKSQGSGPFRQLDEQPQSSDHGGLRGTPAIEQRAGPKVTAFILIPWLCAVVVCLWTLMCYGSGLLIVILPPILLCIGTALLAHIKYRKEQERIAAGTPDDPYNATWPEITLALVSFVASFVSGIVALIAYTHSLQSYAELSLGATYLNVLPSQSALAASDATAIVFAIGTEVDTKRSFGFTDVRNPDGGMYCVAPLSNKWMQAESRVDFFAAGRDCCGQKGSFGCSKAGSSARGALMLAREETAAHGYRNAVKGAASAFGLQPGRGYLLLEMVSDPVDHRHNLWVNALKLIVTYIVVYLFISCFIGYMAHNAAKK